MAPAVLVTAAVRTVCRARGRASPAVVLPVLVRAGLLGMFGFAPAWNIESGGVFGKTDAVGLSPRHLSLQVLQCRCAYVALGSSAVFSRGQDCSLGSLLCQFQAQSVRVWFVSCLQQMPCVSEIALLIRISQQCFSRCFTFGAAALLVCDAYCMRLGWGRLK